MTTLAAVLLSLLSTFFAPGPEPSRHGEWPLLPRPPVVRGFDPPQQAWGAGHRGVDLLGRPGQQVRTSLPGVITFAASLAGRGVVVVEHGDSRTTYEPVTPSVELGEVVAAGEPIGTLQRTHSHCAPATCLHWGLLRGRTYLDPLTLVGAGPVRLLPLTGALLPAPGPAPGPTFEPSPGLRPWGGPVGRPAAAGPW